MATEIQHQPPEKSVAKNNGQHDADKLAGLALLVAVLVQDAGALDQTLVFERGRVKAGALAVDLCASVVAVPELVDHHALEHI